MVFSFVLNFFFVYFCWCALMVLVRYFASQPFRKLPWRIPRCNNSPEQKIVSCLLQNFPDCLLQNFPDKCLFIVYCDFNQWCSILQEIPP